MSETVAAGSDKPAEDSKVEISPKGVDLEGADKQENIKVDGSPSVSALSEPEPTQATAKDSTDNILGPDKNGLAAKEPSAGNPTSPEKTKDVAKEESKDQAKPNPEHRSSSSPAPGKSSSSTAPGKSTESKAPVILASTLPGVKPNLAEQEVSLSVAAVDPKSEEEKNIAMDDSKKVEEDDDVESDVSGSEDEEDEDEDEDEDEEEGEEDEPPTLQVRPGARTPGRKVMQVRTPGATPSADPGSAIKKRGRPSRADMEEREKERQAAIARGEPDPDLKRKRRKPNKLRDGVSEEEEGGDENKGRKKRKQKEENTEDEDGEKQKKKKGRKKLTPKELEERDKERKRKYHELRAAQKAKKEKREQYLLMKREEKKQQKIDEKKKKEEHEKRMAELRAQYLDDNATDGSGGPGTPAEFLFDENSQSSMGSQSMSASMKKKKAWGDVGMQEMMGTHNPLANVTADTLFEYKWPLEGKNSEHYFLQEQVTEYLHVKSFKRKYPDCPRRIVDMEERDFLMEMRIVNETQADLGLTAIPSSAVLDIMCQDFYDRYEAYMTVLNERKERNLRNLNYSSGGGDVKVEEAAKLAAEFNKRLNEDRKEKRKAYFDMQTYKVHFPRNGKGVMKVLQKPKLGNYPIALIPGQFVDSYKAYSSRELRYFPINTVMVPPPKPGVTLKDLNLGSEGSESDSSSSSSGSSDDSESESEGGEDGEHQSPRKKLKVLNEPILELVKEEEEPASAPAPPKPKIIVDEVRPHAVCKMCQGNMNKNKIGLSEMLLHCSKCAQSCHPSCADLHIDLLQYVTNYQWECTDCKMCMKCKDPADEDKMLFCDLCDRGYHIYCVGLQEVPTGRWHCYNCAVCISCATTSPFEEAKVDSRYQGWVHETKLNMKGEKIFSHTMCQPCHKTWKKGLFCPECNGTFDRTNKPTSNCWVCSRQHHTACVGLDRQGQRFICSGCQRKVQERTVGARTGGGKNNENSARQDKFASQYNKTPVTSSFSRSGRRVTQINFSNQF